MENMPRDRPAGRGALKADQKPRIEFSFARRMKESDRTPALSGLLRERAAVLNTDPAPKKSESRHSKSRGLHVLSDFARSFSRGSFSRSSDRTRNVSGSSTMLPGPRPKPPRLSLPRFGRKSLEPSLEWESGHPGPEVQTRPPPPPMPVPTTLPTPDNPRFVVRAMPPQYWTGRFQSLHDQLHSELLERKNLNIIVEAQAAQYSYDLANSPGPEAAGALNNPSTSVYAPNRIPRLILGSYIPSTIDQQIRQLEAGTPTRIPQSQTSNAVLESSPRKRIPTQTVTSPVPPRLLGPRAQPAPRLLSYDQATAAMAPAPFRLLAPPATRVPRVPPKTKKNDAVLESRRNFLTAASNALIDDDARCKRVLLQLEGACMTEEALRSLHDWQEEFARRTNRECLLPPGASMRDPRHSRKMSSGLAGRLGGLLGRKSLTVGTVKTVDQENHAVDHPMYEEHQHHRHYPLPRHRIPEVKSTSEILTGEVGNKDSTNTGVAKPTIFMVI